mgnify:CR=1 FL=1
MKLRKARADEKEIVRALYLSVKGSEGCTWNENYPSDIELDGDLSNDALFVLTENGEIVGAVSVVEPRELDEMPFWQERDHVCEIARVVVRPERQGRGYAERMLSMLFDSIRSEGVLGVHILVAKKNAAASRLYEKLGFDRRGECFEYGIDFFAEELLLKLS